MSEYRPELFAEARSLKMQPHHSQTQGDRLSEAREIVARIERRGNAGKPSAPVLPLGYPQIDAALPLGGLAYGGVHEVLGLAARRFTLHLLGQALTCSAAPVLWAVSASAGHCLYGPGLAALETQAERLIIARCRTRQDLLWTLEEALKSGAFAGVCGECDTPLGATEARRLQLAAETGASLGLLVCEGQIPLSAPGAVTSRWYADPAPAESREEALYRKAALRLDRHRGHNGGPVQWRVNLL